MSESIQQEVSALQDPGSSGNPQIDNLQSQINDLSSTIEELQDQINQSGQDLQAHQHTGLDASSQTEGGPDLKAATLSLSGGTLAARGVELAPLNIYDTSSDISTTRRAFGMGIVIEGDKGKANELVEGIMAIGKDLTSIENPDDFTKFNSAEVNISYNPNDYLDTTGTGKLRPAVPPFASFTGIRTPFISAISGSIVKGGSILTDNSLQLTAGSLVGCKINIINANGSLESWTIAYNSGTTITISGAWISPSGVYQYEVYCPMLLGDAEHPWRRLYVDNPQSDGGLAIRIGQGPTRGSQDIGIYYGVGVPTISANIGSLYLRTDAGSAQLYEMTSSGWTPVGASAINGTASGYTGGVISSGADTPVTSRLEFVNGGISYNGTVFTLTSPGQYLVTGTVTYQSSTDGKIYKTELLANGTQFAEATIQAGVSGTAIGASVSKIINITSTTNIGMSTFQNSGSSQSIYDITYLTFLSVTKI